MIKKILNTPWPAVLWSAFVIILLIIPGNEFEKTGLFHVPGLDKVIHVFLFGIMVLLWCRFYLYKRNEKPQLINTIARIVLLTILIGVIMEFIQKYFIPQRSFDLWDMLADAAGSLIAGFTYFKVWTKK